MLKAWSEKRERQHVKEGLEERGRGEETAEEAKRKNVEGRSSMTKAELEKAVGR